MLSAALLYLRGAWDVSPEALKQWGRQSNGRTCLSLPLSSFCPHAVQELFIKLWFFLVHKQNSCLLLPGDNLHSEHLVRGDKCACTPSNLFFCSKWIMAVWAQCFSINLLEVLIQEKISWVLINIHKSQEVKACSQKSRAYL